MLFIIKFDSTVSSIKVQIAVCYFRLVGYKIISRSIKCYLSIAKNPAKFAEKFEIFSGRSNFGVRNNIVNKAGHSENIRDTWHSDRKNVRLGGVGAKAGERAGLSKNVRQEDAEFAERGRGNSIECWRRNPPSRNIREKKTRCHYGSRALPSHRIGA